MLNTVYQLVAPRKFEVTYENIGLQDDDIIVRPTHLSICNADQRYYQGLREEHVLRQKLPMALIHEGIGVVLRDPSGEFEPGEEVVMIPNTPVEEDEFIAENYLRSSKFRASGFNGFMQEYVKILGKKENPYPYIQACDVYIQPSRYEGKCVTVREAQMLGKPVIITNYETAKEQLESGVEGIIVPMQNQECADQIFDLLNNNCLLEQLSFNCQMRKYSNKEEVKKIYRILEKSNCVGKR